MSLLHRDTYLLEIQRVVFKGHRDTGKEERRRLNWLTTAATAAGSCTFRHLCYLSADCTFSNHKTRAWSCPSVLLAEGLSGGQLVASRRWHSSESSAVAVVQGRSHFSGTLSHCRKETESYSISESRIVLCSLVMKQKLADRMLLCSRQGGHLRRIQEVFI